ncbi:MAG: hypothetical protein LC118_16420 [Dehalococcoidia bacterium]|nr:hypothetical protein [Dehalococcoidia bacterium]
MADLKVPERCSLCGEPFQEGDRISFWRCATLYRSRYFKWDKAQQEWVEATNPNSPLRPRVESRPIRGATHQSCPAERVGG